MSPALVPRVSSGPEQLVVLAQARSYSEVLRGQFPLRSLPSTPGSVEVTLAIAFSEERRVAPSLGCVPGAQRPLQASGFVVLLSASRVSPGA